MLWLHQQEELGLESEEVEGDNVKEAEERKGIHVDINRFAWIEMRRILWKHSLSFQEFFSYLTKLLITGDKRLHDLLLEAKAARAQSELPSIVHTDEESLYSLIEQMRGTRKQ